MSDCYDPDGKPITHQEWSEMFSRRFEGDDDSWWRKQTKVGNVSVSTVWLGLDHGWEAAHAHHAAIVAALEAGEPVPEPAEVAALSSHEGGGDGR